VYLVDQMHQSLNKVLQIEDQPPIPPPLTTSAQLKHFAREAEVNRDFQTATRYYQERIIRDEVNADNWFDFGTFNLFINNVSKVSASYLTLRLKCLVFRAHYICGHCWTISSYLFKGQRSVHHVCPWSKVGLGAGIQPCG
jgi:hypothetical protein